MNASCPGVNTAEAIRYLLSRSERQRKDPHEALENSDWLHVRPADEVNGADGDDARDDDARAGHLVRLLVAVHRRAALDRGRRGARALQRRLEDAGVVAAGSRHLRPVLLGHLEGL